MIVLAIFKKICIFSLFPLAKPKNFFVFVFTSVSRSPMLFDGDFYMNLYSVDSDEAMKRWNEAMKRLTVHRFKF
jgi:hypothetical protein